MFPTNRGICFSLKAIPSSMKALDSCTVGAQSHPHLLRDTIVVHGLSGAVSRFKKSIEMLRFWKRYRWISPIERRNGLIVKPCTNTEKATTAKLMVMISSRCGTSGGKSKGKSKRQCSSYATPEQDMLMFHRDAKRGARKNKTTGIDRYRPAQRHQRNRNHRRKPYRHEILMGFVHSDQEKHQASSRRRRRIPKMPGRLPSPARRSR